MAFINELAFDFCKRRFTQKGQLNSPPQTVINDAKEQLLDIIDTKDRIIFLKTILESAENCKHAHLKICTNKDCQMEKDINRITYFLGQDLISYGVPLNEDTFTYEERNEATEK